MKKDTLLVMTDDDLAHLYSQVCWSLMVARTNGETHEQMLTGKQIKLAIEDEFERRGEQLK